MYMHTLGTNADDVLFRHRYSPVFLSDSAPRTDPAPKPVDATLEAGDVLYLPALWVHEVRRL